MNRNRDEIKYKYTPQHRVEQDCTVILETSIVLWWEKEDF